MQTEPPVRFGFRILAGIIAASILLIGLPSSFLEAIDRGGVLEWFLVLGCLAGGIGLAIGAKTGYWPFILTPKKRHD